MHKFKVLIGSAAMVVFLVVMLVLFLAPERSPFTAVLALAAAVLLLAVVWACGGLDRAAWVEDIDDTHPDAHGALDGVNVLTA